MASIDSEDVRSLFKLVGELRELGDDPTAWRVHLAGSLERLCNTAAVLVAELVRRDTPPGVSCKEAVDIVDIATSGLGRDERSSFINDVVYLDHVNDPAMRAVIPNHGVDMTRARWDILPDEIWYRTMTATEKFRPRAIDDFILSQANASSCKSFVAVQLYRPWGEARFSERDRTLVSVVNEEIVRSLDAAAGPRLGPRRREVLEGLQTGFSEKEIAASLDLSPHTTHDHVKAIYRAYGVRARPELMAKLATGRRKQLRLHSVG